MSELFPNVTEMVSRTWCISEYGLVNVFLLEGNEFAALIDTGCGIANVKKVAEDLTRKPLKILLTHGHPDHNGAVYQFPESDVYMNPADEAMLEHFGPTNAFREAYIRTRVPIRFPGEGHVEVLVEMLPVPEPPVKYDYIPLQDGDIIDLGGRKLRVICSPGHSEGSICLLDFNTRILFSGDTVSHSNIIARLPENDPKLIQQYHDSVQAIWNWQEDYDMLAIGHDGTLMDKEIVKDYLELTEGLLNGSIVGQYEESGFRKGDVARLGGAELWYHCDA